MKALLAVHKDFQEADIIAAELKKDGYETHVQKCAFEDFPFAAVVAEKFDLIVIDNDIESEDLTYPGLVIVRNLRADHRLGTPCVIFNVDIQEVEQSLNKGKLEYLNIIYSPGLMLLDKKDNAWKLDAVGEIRKLSQAAVTDVAEMLLDLKGYLIDKITHKLKFIPISSSHDSEQDVEKATRDTLDWVEEFLNSFFTPSENMRIEYPKFRDALYSAQMQFDKDEYNKLREELRSKCEIEVESRKGSPPKKYSNKRFKILLLDDDPGWLEMVKENLSDSFEVIPTSSGLEAISILDSDKNNDIHGVVTDWRLYNDFNEQSKWQEVQGYDILDYAAKNSSRALIALTSLNDAIVHKIRNELNLNITLITKDFLNFEENADLFKNIIAEKCNEAVARMASMPSATNWFKGDNSLHAQYLSVRSSGDWKAFEENVTNKANEAFIYYQQAFDWDKLKTLQDFGKKFGLPLAQKGTPLLENILIMRRVWLALWWNLDKLEELYFNDLSEHLEIKIYCVLRQSFIEDSDSFDRIKDGIPEYLNRSKQLCNNLCIKPGSLPNDILQEEKTWLNRHGIDINKGNRTNIFEFD